MLCSSMSLLVIAKHSMIFHDGTVSEKKQAEFIIVL